MLYLSVKLRLLVEINGVESNESFKYKIISDNCRMRGATRTLILELGLQT